MKARMHAWGPSLFLLPGLLLLSAGCDDDGAATDADAETETADE